MRTRFNIFGQPVELLVTSLQTAGSYSLGRQTCAPGTGVPPHLHRHEDEVFSVISGRFEILNGETWTELPPGGIAFAPRNGVHSFRNSGDTEGIIQFISGGAAFDTFLEGLSAYTLPDDLQAVVDYSARFGIFYPTLPPPTDAPAEL